ncbi:MAG TPA: helix-turn-helix domain-containing protein [Pseudonocardia sp.]|nr:helix-turn-helix domain-containing protein [Pseudonocardia sp.]
MRADAVRNRERLLVAADLVFDELGIGASTEEVARRAEVGIGTVFRHFPTKESLLEAVYLARLCRLADTADKLSRSEGAGAAFFSFLDTVADQACGKRAFTESLANAGVDVEAAAAPAKLALRQSGDTLLERAQQAGAVRKDLRTEELWALLVGLARTAEYTAHDPDLRSRTVGILMDGLRPR